MTRVWHPSVNTDTGEICQAAITANWSPTQNIRTVMEAIYNMLKTPDSEATLMPEIAAMLKRSEQNGTSEFHDEAQKFVRSHAM